ncbi:MAG: AAA family ATPase [Eubacterium sp.]|nr:AAA family ATPase [Eubacterium sp.]
MRPLFLRFKGINCYTKEQTIDFSTLTSRGLFGIFGPTGSGKSSILDAITLALYAKLPRETKNFINLNEKTATVSFRFSITTNKVKTYLVERSFRYSNQEKSTVRNITARLIEYVGEEETVLADKPMEVTGACTSLLGLSSDDFMRTVVLPQGQFSEFLKLKNKDRRIMLQRIFHLEKYGEKLTNQIARAKRDQDLTLSQLSGEQKAYENISEENIENLKKELKTKRASLNEVSENLRILSDRFSSAEEILSLQKELSPVEEIFFKNQELLPKIQEKEALLLRKKKANEIRPFEEQKNAAKKKKEEALTLLKKTEQEVEFLLLEYNTQKEKKEELSLQWTKKQPVLQNKIHILENAKKAADTIKKWNQQLEQYHNDKNTFTETLLKKKDEHSLLIHKEQILRNKILSYEKKKEEDQISPEYKKMLDEGHLMEETYREQKKHYEQNCQEFKKIQYRMEKEEKEKKRQLIFLCDISSFLNQKISITQKNCDSLDNKLNQIKQGQIKNQEEQEQWKIEHMAVLLRKDLSEGIPCPVCGSVHHDTFIKNHDADTTSLTELEQQEKELKRNEEQTRENLKKEEQNLSLLKSYQESLSAFPEIAPELSKNFLSDTEYSLKTIPGLLTTYSSQIGICQKQTEQFNEKKNALHNEHLALKRKAQDILTLRKENGIDNFSQALTVLQEKEAARSKEERTIRESRKELDKIQEKKDALFRDLSSLNEKISAATSGTENCEKIIAEQKKEIPDDYSPASDFSSLLLSAREELSRAEKDKLLAEELFMQTEKTLRAKKEELVSRKSAASLSEEHFRQAETLYYRQKEKNGFSPQDNLSEYYMEEDILKKQEDEVRQFYEHAEENKNKRQYLKNKLNNRHIEEEEWASLQETLKTSKEKEQELRSSLDLITHQIKEEEKKIKEKKELENKMEKEKHKRDLIKELESLFKGNAFVEYIAQSKLSYIARQASQILSKISGGNYALEINELSEFIIRDNKNGGILRPCDTLSGGETFITSLALALALSSSIQLNGSAPLEFFFLDEGFGSLDDELLDTVMTSLERLQSQKRSIGIISHVESIQARVPVKLIVSPSDLPQQGSTIRLEYS